MTDITNTAKKTAGHAISFRQDGELQFYLIAAILYQCFFIVAVIGFYHIVIIPGSLFRVLTKEYLLWYMEQKPAVSYEQTAIELCWIVKLLCTPIFLLAAVRTLTQPEYYRCIKASGMLASILTGILVYGFVFFYNKYQADHYRLYMTLLSTEILSLVLLGFFWKIRASSQGIGRE